MVANNVEGVIVGRRSMGQKLAFADIATKTSLNKNDGACTIKEDVINPIKIIFRHQSFVGPSGNNNNIDDASSRLNEPFPNKDASLPYGAQVIVQLGNCQKVPSKDKDNDDVWEVLRWKMNEHPRILAEQLASLEVNNSNMNGDDEMVVGSGATSCTTYFKARGDAFELARQHRTNLLGVKDGITQTSTSFNDHKKKISSTSSDVPPLASNANNTIHTSDNSILDYSSEFHHGGKQAKAKRAKVFASWVLHTFFGVPMDNTGDPCQRMICQSCGITSSNDVTTDIKNEKLQLTKNNNVHVLDVAGGKGQLSLELIVQQMYHLGISSHGYKDNNDRRPISHCTIIDPLVRKSDAKQRHRQLKKASSHVDWLLQQQQKQKLDQKYQNVSLDDTSTKANDKNDPTSKDTRYSGAETSVIQHVAMNFNSASFADIYSQCIQQSQSSRQKQGHEQEQSTTTRLPMLLLGLHPDQCTESILDVALEYNVSVAIVPCCGERCIQQSIGTYLASFFISLLCTHILNNIIFVHAAHSLSRPISITTNKKR